jgi:thiamine-monophosphate kinase
VPGETELIDRYFRLLGAVRPDVALGIGDDAALLRVPAGQELVQTTDALVAGAHFLGDDDPESIGYRLLAANLSDLAAMGAEPAWALLSLTLPEVDEPWLAAFARGFGLLAREQGVALVGGNLARGPLQASLALSGFVPVGQALRRDGARAGDELWTSGWPGEARAGLALSHPQLRAGGLPGANVLDGPTRAELVSRWQRPAARVRLGIALRGLASAAIDLSDGLWVDLGRLARASGCAAQLERDALPVSAALAAACGAEAWQELLAGGEDYELCFAAAPGRADEVRAAGAAGGVPLARIGRLVAGGGIQLMHAGAVMQFSAPGFDHFGS